MTRHKGGTESSGELRRQAEKRLGHIGSVAGEENLSQETRKLVQELQVHQIELEMQNEELQRAREEAEEERACYADLYEFAPVGYLTLGRDGVIRRVNLTGARLIGQERARLVGRRLAALLAPDHTATFNSFFAKALDIGTKEVCEVVLGREGAAPLTVELVATSSTSSEGLECRVTMTDITPRKRAEQERTDLLSQLVQAQKMEAVGALAGGIAHDFNNILAAILAWLSSLDLEFTDTSAGYADIQEMKGLVKRGADLTHQLLGFACRGKYDVRPLDLARVVTRTSAMFARTRQDITFELHLRPDLHAVLMDQTQLDQVLLNLLINAAQAMPDGGQLILSAENASLAPQEVAPHGAVPGRFVKLVVTDTGIGMDAATQARIFEPFFTTKPRGEGTGLGLASVYGILKAHAGIITVKSEVGNGTSFTLYLPTTDQPLIAGDNTPAPQHGTGTILVVDDDEHVAKLVARLLRKLGYDVLTASGGRQAVEILRQHGKAISLVILDMIMPDMGGSQTFDALVKIAPRLKVLLSTGFSVNGHIQELLDRGCKGFLQKPFDVATLSAKVQEILQGD
ncbi:MAG TPA: response regulator [Polyangia bacterium]